MATFTDHPGGDIFASGADVLVCPVNCVPGIMGAGLALAFAKRWPGLRRRHATLARDGRLAVGLAPIVGEAGRDFCLFPSKRHWRLPSTLSDVALGLDGLRIELANHRAMQRRRPLESIAIPALGCGLGRLAWADVRSLIVAALADLPMRVMLFPPHEVAP
jgi:O-acetyl-ADP-ribose deacetylase (regulator of RNase III)